MPTLVGGENITDENIEPTTQIVNQTNFGVTDSDRIINTIKGLFENEAEKIIIKTPVETIEFSKDDFESEKVQLNNVTGSNLLTVSIEGKIIVLFLNEVSITGLKE